MTVNTELAQIVFNERRYPAVILSQVLNIQQQQQLES